MRSDSRQRVFSAIQRRPVGKVPKGELCIEDAVVKRELGCDAVGFEERLEFVKRLGVDIICLAPKRALAKGSRSTGMWFGRTSRDGRGIPLCSALPC